ncbi:IS110 family transposase [uncultured Amphritea sp.]|uniref:IS110 family transposase n=1 Tax=uncultured Amphritea sp. TaxID=981605 RepID=UPI0025D002CB|nr:IS110 family transposase [uncultured Amphritea sp.]
MNISIAGVDLAKKVIQICVVKRNTVLSNKEMTPSQFEEWLAKSKPMTVVFEGCSTSNYWKQTAEKQGHQAKLISAKLVSTIRQKQKTDANDALAIVQASQLTGIQFINGKTVAQQELQSLLRMCELAVKQKVALQNQVRALLAEFNIHGSPPAKGGLSGIVQRTLEDAENGFSMPFRDGLHATWQACLLTINRIKAYDECLAQAIKQHPDCQRLMALEGVSVINAINLYILLGCSDDLHFKNEREASACVGVTPIQHSTGGNAKLGSIGHYVKHGILRSQLISGAMAVVGALSKRLPKTSKEVWLKQLIERREKRCAAVALANKTIRTAFAMLSKGTEYQAQAITA